MYILGINAFHADSAACLIKDGELLCAVEEERLQRVKHWAGFPSMSIEWCLAQAGINLSQVDHIGINSDPKANFGKKLAYTLANRPEFRLIIDRLKNKNRRMSIDAELSASFPNQKFQGVVHKIEHHISHLASAHLVSPFEDSVSVSVDGFGDFSSAAWGLCRGSDINPEHRVYFPHSLGVFYQALTQFLGFPHYGDEYKIMGLAPYGEPRFLEQMRDIVKLKSDGTFALNLAYFKHHKEKVAYEWSGGQPVVGSLFMGAALENLLGVKAREKHDPLEQIHKDLARSVQAMYEEAFFSLLNAAYNEYQVDSLTLSGGCAMNSVANGKVYRRTPFKHVYIQSAAGDAGGAIGAAFSLSAKLGLKRNFVMDHAYWGPEYTSTDIKSILQNYATQIDNANCTVTKLDLSTLISTTAQAIADGKVIGWFQGRLEWGPRALGNRSILGDPRRSNMKGILNIKIKKRESFRPFAPSILREEVKNWFEEDDEVPFMMKVFQIQEGQRKKIPAVTHEDGSGRLQTVYEASNPRYHALIKEFGRLTGVPILLNTSFNENEPVVCNPSEALNCFLRTSMDILVIGDYLLQRADAQVSR